MVMQHTYLRYECADAFGLAASTSSASHTTGPLAILPSSAGGSSSSSPTGSSTALSLSCSHLLGINLRTLSPSLKMAHRERLSGGAGTGRALNSDEITCVDAAPTGDGGARVATGWTDGAVRVFELKAEEVERANGGGDSRNESDGPGLVNSLLLENEDDFLTRDPLVLNGHTGPVKCVSFDRTTDGIDGADGAGSATTRLASGGSDGAVVIWDVAAETGLFRLKGHAGPIADTSFARVPGKEEGAPGLDALITSCSGDGLVKVWDLDGQCCVQTAVASGRKVCCSSLARIGGNASDDDVANEGRWRLVAGCADGSTAVWSIEAPTPRSSSSNADAAATEEGAADLADNEEEEESLPLRPMGLLTLPANVPSPGGNTSSKSVHFHPSGKYVGVHKADGKEVLIFKVRSGEESRKKRTRRLRRRREKGKDGAEKVNAEGDEATGGKEKGKKNKRKRGILDSDSESDDEADTAAEGTPQAPQHDAEALSASDEFEYLATIRATHRLRGFSFLPGKSIKVVCALSTNALELHAVKKIKDAPASAITQYEATKVRSADLYGHPTGIRSLALSSDDRRCLSVSKNVAKVWNVSSRTCLRSLPLVIPTNDDTKKKGGATHCYGLCSAFLPGNAHAVVGTREGHLLILDVDSGDVVHFEENAHDGAVWSLDVKRPAVRGGSMRFEVDGEEDADMENIAVVTGSADKSVKFWDLVRGGGSESDSDSDSSSNNAAPGTGHPELEHARTLTMSDDVVAVRYSHPSSESVADSEDAGASKRMVFVSTLDSKVNVFFDDSLKFYLCLYGHKLPALALDSSDDGSLLVTAGADKSVRIWGLDFGDCHKTLYGHTDSVTDVKFVRGTHYLFTASKDGTLRYWDADRFTQVQVLGGHAAECNALAVGRTGAFALTGGMDRQVRVWERTRDMVFPEEERERELEEGMDKADAARGEEGDTAEVLRRRKGDGDDDEDEDDAGEEQPQSAAAVRKSVLSVASGDRIAEALEVADKEAADLASFNRSQRGKTRPSKRRPNPLLLGMEPSPYVLWVLRSVKPAELEQSLLVLPLGHVERLVMRLIANLRDGRGVEVCARASAFLIRAHQNQIISNRSLVTPLRELRRLLRLRLGHMRDAVGYNLAALRAVARTDRQRKSSRFIPDENANGDDVWAGLGLGSDVAAALERKGRAGGEGSGGN